LAKEDHICRRRRARRSCHMRFLFASLSLQPFPTPGCLQMTV
jgi:hypothetical protein